MPDKELAAFLQVEQRIGQRLALNHGDERAVVALCDRAGDAWRILVKYVINETGA